MWDAYMKNVARNNEFDNDRTFPVYLSEHGNIGYITRPSVYVRQHALRHAWSPTILSKHFILANETTQYLWQNYRDIIVPAAEKFNAVLENLSSHECAPVWTALRNRVQEPHLSTVISECGFDLEPLRPCLTRRHTWKSVAKAICPPVVLECVRRLRSRMSGGWEGDMLRWQEQTRQSEKKEQRDAA
jgi:hypothetical protein